MIEGILNTIIINILKEFLFKVSIKYDINYKELQRMLKIENSEYEEVNVDEILEIYLKYPEEFINFCTINDLNPPKITSGNGKALSAMLYNPFKFWTRSSCDKFVKKFNIQTKDSIQLFNKHSQWGIKTNSGIEKGKLYIMYPYCLSNKHKIRKNFKFNGTNEEKNMEIEKIKSTIKNDYIDISNEKWQLGHKNPELTNNNLILQPPIQGKYRDDYLFFDTLTKMPLPKKLKKLIETKEIELSKEQINGYLDLFQSLNKF